ncbi:unnamed protein product [Cyprideis torosa]|uniref:ubiquitinyl hydrolase 1 n=1 Tax=Cyprideis torosa TaxID=163714 RepID=A0A7R8ZJX9_9CRUS|nr:unnamed protein product [Cyprideis torosa]CAG0888134.1 unnamed protein product [Cyprideis torosa]
MESIVHEQQEGQLCAQHCLNALLQGTYFTAVDLSEIAQDLDLQERTQMAVGGVDTDQYRQFISVIEKALECMGLQLLPYHSQNPVSQQARSDPTSQSAYVLNYRNHWFTVRKLGFQWFNLNSMLTGPELISDTYLAIFLAQLDSEGYSIFVVTGDLPPCPADDALRVSPAEQRIKPKLISEVSGQRSGKKSASGSPSAVSAEEVDPELEEALRRSLDDTLREEHENQLQQAIRMSLREAQSTSQAIMLLGSAQNKVVLNFSRCNPKLFWKNSNSSLLLRLPIASAIPYHPLTNNRRSISFETINVVSKWKELEYSRRVSLVKHSLPIFKFALYTAWIPMLLPCFYMLAWWSSSRFLSVCMLYYGALLLSFQGGIRLGDNLRNLQAPDGQYTIYWSAVPPTLAFMSLLLPLGYSDLSLVLGHALVTYVDVTRSDYPEKYKEEKSHESAVSSTLSNLDYWSRISALGDNPASLKLMGFLGLVPMLFPTIYMMVTLSSSPFMSAFMLYYSASILSFLGGIRWGDNLRETNPDHIYWSAIPPSIACVSLLLPLNMVNLSLIFGHGITAYFDATSSDYPEEFKGLRLALTTVMIVCLILEMLGRTLLPSSERRFSYTYSLPSESTTVEKKPDIQSPVGSLLTPSTPSQQSPEEQPRDRVTPYYETPFAIPPSSDGSPQRFFIPAPPVGSQMPSNQYHLQVPLLPPTAFPNPSTGTQFWQPNDAPHPSTQIPLVAQADTVPSSTPVGDLPDLRAEKTISRAPGRDAILHSFTENQAHPNESPGKAPASPEQKQAVGTRMVKGEEAIAEETRKQTTSTAGGSAKAMYHYTTTVPREIPGMVVIARGNEEQKSSRDVAGKETKATNS